MADNRIVQEYIFEAADAVKTIAQLRKEQRALRAEVESNQEGTLAYDQALAKLVGVTRQLREQQRPLESALKKVNKSLGGVNDDALKLDGTLQGLRIEAKELEAELNQARLGSAEFNRLTQRLQEVNTQIREVRISTRALGSGLDEQVAAGLKRAGVSAKDFGRELKGALSGLQGQQLGNQLNTVLGSFGRLGVAIPAVAAVAGGLQIVGDAAGELLNAAQAARELAGQVEALGIASGQAARETAALIEANQRAFGTDTHEQLRAVNALVNEFGISGEEAAELLGRAIVQTGNAVPDLADQFREYSAQIALAGGNAQDLSDILVAQAELGIFGDKGIDAIKEFGLSIREQTTATRDALVSAFGEPFTNELLASVNAGETSILEAFDTVTQRLGDLSPQSQAFGLVIADVFRGAGEDAGQLLLELGKVRQELASGTREASEYEQALEAQRQGALFAAQANQSLALSIGGAGDGFQLVGHYLSGGFAIAIGGIIVLVRALGHGLRALYFAAEAAANALIFDFDAAEASLKRYTEELGKGDEIINEFVESVIGGGDAAKQAASDNEAAQAAQARANAEARADAAATEEQVKQAAAAREEAAKRAEQVAASEQRATLETLRLRQQEAETIASQVQDFDMLAKARTQARDALEAQLAIQRQALEEGLTDEGVSQATLQARLQAQQDADAQQLAAFDAQTAALVEAEAERQEAIAKAQADAEAARLAQLKQEQQALLAARQQELAAQEQSLRLQAEQTRNVGQRLELLVRLRENLVAQAEAQLAADLQAAQGASTVAEKQSLAAAATLRYQNALAGLNAELGALNTQQGRTAQLIQDYSVRIGEAIQEYVQPAVNLIGQLAQAENRRTQEAIEQSRERQQLAEEDVAALEKELETATGARRKALEQQAEQRQQVAEGELKQQEQLQKEAAAREKAIAVTQSIIQGALAVSRALAAPPGFPFNLPAVIAAGIQAAAQTAIIAAQQFAQGGILQGPSHAQGGITLTNGRGTVFGEAEGGEVILTKGVSRNPALLAQASAINQAAGGRPLAPAPRMQLGGVALPVAQLNGASGAGANVEVVAALEELGNRLADLQPVVSVQEIDRVRGQVVQVQQSGRL